MLLTVTDLDLAQLLESDTLMAEVWRDAACEVMALLQLLHNATSNLAEVVKLGLIALAASPMARSALVLQYRRVSLVARGHRDDGSEVISPKDHPDEVTHLEVHGVQVAALAQATR